MTGDELKELRKRLNLSQQALGDYWGVHRVTVGVWERTGPAMLPNPKMMAILAKDLRRKFGVLPPEMEQEWQ